MSKRIWENGDGRRRRRGRAPGNCRIRQPSCRPNEVPWGRVRADLKGLRQVQPSPELPPRWAPMNPRTPTCKSQTPLLAGFPFSPSGPFQNPSNPYIHRETACRYLVRFHACYMGFWRRSRIRRRVAFSGPAGRLDWCPEGNKRTLCFMHVSFWALTNNTITTME